MRDGIYSVTFTTTDGVMGIGTCLISGNRYVGVDFTQCCYGEIRRYDGTIMVDMRVIRHPYLRDVALKLPADFNVSWSGSAWEHGFYLEARFLETGDLIRATGALLKREDGNQIEVTPPQYLDHALERHHPLSPD